MTEENILEAAKYLRLRFKDHSQTTRWAPNIKHIARAAKNGLEQIVVLFLSNPVNIQI